MNDVAICVENLGKRFRVSHTTGAASYRTFREDVLHLPSRLWRAIRHARGESEEFWALRDVSFELKKGEILGLIGRNGAGKSTLLKVLSRIMPPSTGSAELYGRVGSLLEVGTGFHPELTGRENIYLSGAILGMRRAEIRARFDEIVGFSGVERFIDTPTKHYSSGMFLRLGFAVAAHLEAEVLIVDEVLAVGDAEFQNRCLRKMESLTSKSGRTVLFVSHNIAAVRQLCSRALYLRAGEIVAHGAVNDVVERYGADQGSPRSEYTRKLPPGIECGFEAIRLVGDLTVDRSGFVYGHSIDFEIDLRLARALRNVQVALRISTNDGAPVLTTSNWDSSRQTCGLSAGRHRFRGTIPPMLAPGGYKMTLALCEPQREMFDVVEDTIGLTVDRVGSLAMDLNDNRRGCVELPLSWTHEVLP